MTIQDLLDLSLNFQKEIVYFFIAIPFLAFVSMLFKKKHWSNKAIKLFNSVLVYLVSIPWILSFLLMLYSLFMLGSNVLELNALLYFLPIVSMFWTYWIIQKNVWLKEVPWFGKISSLLLLISLSFIVLLILQKMFIWIIFIGSIWHIIWLFAIIFIAMKIAFDKLVKQKNTTTQ